MLDDSFEDFIGSEDVFYCAYVNDKVWNGAKIIEEEKFLEIYMYSDENANVDGTIPGKMIAMFRGNQWKYARAL